MPTSFDIIFENEDFIVINKPSGLLSIPDRMQSTVSLKELLQQRFEEIYTIHRLDKETSGLILFAKNKEAHQKFSQLFENREVEKYYLGIVLGVPQPYEQIIEAPITSHAKIANKMQVHSSGKPAVTGYKVIESFSAYALVAFRLYTGKTHQIRLHMSHIGHPVVCDSLYGNGQPIYVSALKRNYRLSQKEEVEKPLLSRLALHSWKLKFTYHAQWYEFEAPLFKDMKAVLQQLRKI